MQTEVIRDPSVKQDEMWVVVVDGLLTSPTFNSKGAAEAYSDMLQRGQRKPEYRQ